MSLSTAERERRKSGQLQTSTDETGVVFLKSQDSYILLLMRLVVGS